MMTVDYRPGEDELTKYKAYKRRKGQGAGSNAEYSSTHEPRPTEEALSIQQRLSRKRLMKRLKPKIELGRKRAKRKMADKKKLEKRALRQAKTFILKKMTKGIAKDELSYNKRQEIEKRLEKPAVKQRIKMLARKLFKDVRKKEVERKKA